MKKISLFLFSICFAFSTKAQYNVDFENWHTVLGTLNIPNDWNATDSLLKYFGALTNPGATFQAQVEKETPGYSGNGAMKVISKSHPGLPTILPAGVAPCIAANCKIDVNTSTGEFTFIGGRPYTQYPTAATMWVKNNVLGGDSTSIGLYLIDNSDGGDSIVAWADTILDANITNYTQLNLPFKYNPTPGFTPVIMRIIVSSSTDFYIDTSGAFTGLTDGTWISVDDINVQAPAGVTSLYSSGERVASVYPTTFNHELVVSLKEKQSSVLTLDMLDINGKIVANYKLNSVNEKLNTSMLSSGMYIYRIMDKDTPIQTGKLIKN